ncbi:MAG: dihydroorotase [Firmicutes bacterium]|nr:dihydroorotase [Bacillota bacterium]
MDYCLKGGFVVDPVTQRQGKLDVLIRDGRIAAVGPELDPAGAEVFPVAGLHILPGLVDMHVHLREPGREDEETIATGLAAAAAGGFTAVAAMPNTDPALDNPALIAFVLAQAERVGGVRLCAVGCLTKGQRGEEMAELGELVRGGAVAFSNDGVPLPNAEILRLAMEYSKIFGLPILLHAQDAHIGREGVMHEGRWSTVLGLPGIPALAEEVAVARDLLLAAATGAAVHIQHVSTAGAVAMIRQAKEQGIKVTAEATPHHLILTDAAVAAYDTNTKVNPPLRSEADRAALREGLTDGTIDVIASDHAPHTLEEKHREFALAPDGMVGLETSLGLVLTELVRPGLLSLDEMVMKMAVNPRRILGLPEGSLTPGLPADLTVVDLERTWRVDPGLFRSKAKNTPFAGRELVGKAVATFVGGRLVHRE